MKSRRQEKILELIQDFNIETQEELTKRLQEAGFASTQGTISRDIRELGLTKITWAGGRQKYSVIVTEHPQVSSKYRRVLSEAILSMEAAGNLLVIKTVAGMAMACAAAIDSIKIKGVVGSIAGDDTIMCAIRDGILVKDVITEIGKIMKE